MSIMSDNATLSDIDFRPTTGALSRSCGGHKRRRRATLRGDDSRRPRPLRPPRAPAWARPSGSFREISEAEALFFAGAALVRARFRRQIRPAVGRRLARPPRPEIAPPRSRRTCSTGARTRRRCATRSPSPDPARISGRRERSIPPSAPSAAPATPSARSGSPPSPPTCRRRSTSSRAGELAAALEEAAGRGRPAPLAAAAAAEAVIDDRAPTPSRSPCFAPTPRWPRRSAGRSPLPLLAGELFARRSRARDGGRARARPAGASSSRSLTPARRSPPSTWPRTCRAARPG